MAKLIVNSYAAEQAFNWLIQRHKVLRSVFVASADHTDAASETDVIQQVRDDVQFSLVSEDCSSLSEAQQHQRIKQAVYDQNYTEFDLTSDLMIRAKWLQLATNDGVLLVTFHHIAADSWSMTIFVNEFMTAYRTFVAEQTPQLALQYIDFAAWQREQIDVYAEQLAYWKTALADLALVHNLPLDHPRAPQCSPKVLKSVTQTNLTCCNGIAASTT